MTLLTDDESPLCRTNECSKKIQRAEMKRDRMTRCLSTIEYGQMNCDKRRKIADESRKEGLGMGSCCQLLTRIGE